MGWGAGRRAVSGGGFGGGVGGGGVGGLCAPSSSLLSSKIGCRCTASSSFSSSSWLLGRGFFRSGDWGVPLMPDPPVGEPSMAPVRDGGSGEDTRCAERAARAAAAASRCCLRSTDCSIAADSTSPSAACEGARSRLPAARAERATGRVARVRGAARKLLPCGTVEGC